jgi:hypothetical protein
MTVGHVHDAGSILKLQVVDQDGEAVSLTAATAKEFWFRKPGNIHTKVDALFFTNGADGWLQYTFTANDMTSPGTWFAQAVVTLPGSLLHSSYYQFNVEPNLE